MTAKPVPKHISDERLAEMLAVTEHVPNGDWTVDGWEIISSRRYPIATIDRHSRDAEPIKAHLLNCHPDTIAAILTELARRGYGGPVSVEVFSDLLDTYTPTAAAELAYVAGVDVLQGAGIEPAPWRTNLHQPSR